jgi:hypothetical protein
MRREAVPAPEKEAFASAAIQAATVSMVDPGIDEDAEPS